ncbi:glycosyl transferase family group 2-domain-containing protein [Delphinella strobiligena]|nr:glycosyl transferase family group 2-domain-containing protein [Delphinella strobiligena]
MVNWLYQQQMELLWTAGGHDEGIVLKKSRNAYTCCPSDLDQEPAGFSKAIQTLNVRCAMTVNTRVIKLFLHGNDRPYVPLKDGLRLQVLPDISYLPRCQKHQFAAFIADRGILVVWDDEPRHLLKRAQNIQEALMAMIWPEEGEEEIDEKDFKNHDINVNEFSGEEDVEATGTEKPRKIVLNQSIITSFTLALIVVVTGLGYQKVAKEIYLDGNYVRLCFVLVFIPQSWLSLFFFQAVIGNLSQLFGPISQVNSNSKYYSGVAPKRLRIDDGPLPHVTIQAPVYKEGLQSVIEPTIRSIKAAISTYEMQGGTANIFVNDDGMQLISESEARARQDFYDEHNIGWVARPRHDPKGEHGEAFTRRGKFKKASNMNYSLWASNRVEDKLAMINRPVTWTQDDEAEAYRNALVEVVEEDQGRTWADGNIRIGDYILIIDSDTRVPTDCLLDAVSEMHASPQVGIIQFNSGVMNVTESFFERGITFFTNLVYTQIKYAVANGDVAPFVGHNAMLRWAAVQSIVFEDEDNREKFWSESTVSEDFDMALRLQAAGFIVRYAAYFGDGFKEGVSLTVYDELARWEKYAYGCNELLFHPIAQWFKKGPFTPLFCSFIASGMPLPSKLTIMAYIGTYYALGSAWLLTTMNYFIMGWFNGWLDHYYLDSFKVYLAIVVVFTGLGNLSLAILRYRIGEMGLGRAIWTNLKWIPLMTIFFGGISMHVSQALLSHMFGIDMNWGATSKEAENTSFFQEVPKVIKSFKWTFAICILLAITMIVCAVAIPELWQIHLLIAIYPLSIVIASHFLLPIALNPGLMKFTF